MPKKLLKIFKNINLDEIKKKNSNEQIDINLFYSEFISKYLSNISSFKNLTVYDYYVIILLCELGLDLNPLRDFLYGYLNSVYLNNKSKIDIETSCIIINKYIMYYNFITEININDFIIDKELIELVSDSSISKDFSTLQNYLNSNYSDLIYVNDKYINISNILSSKNSINSKEGSDIFTHRKYYRYSGIISRGIEMEYNNLEINHNNSVFFINSYNNIIKEVIEIVEYINNNIHPVIFLPEELSIYINICILNDEKFNNMTTTNIFRENMEYFLENCL